MSSLGETLADGAPPYDDIAFIDESGDPHIERVRPRDNPGGTEWLTFGAVLIEASREHEPVAWVRQILDDIGGRRPELHYRNLLEWQKPRVCQKLALLPVVLFAFLSNKKNMRGYENARAAAKSNPLTSKQYFYNYCLRLLLERITDYVHWHSTRAYGQPRYVKLIFSKRDGHNYAHLLVYNEVLRIQARAGTTYLRKREVKWEVIHPRLQSSETSPIFCLDLSPDNILKSFCF